MDSAPNGYSRAEAARYGECALPRQSRIRFLAGLLSLVAGIAFVASGWAADALEQGFISPPPSARPWAYWFWLDGNVTRAGLTADLEAMQRVGLGGAVLLDASQELPAGPVRFGSEEWRQLFKHTIAEARRLGLEIALQNGPGWCGSGGPWITPALGMQMLSSSRTNLAGPGHFQGLLPPVPDDHAAARPVATLAFPTLVGEGARVPGFAPAITASVSAGFVGTNLVDQNPSTLVSLPAPTARRPQYLQAEFAAPFSASTFKLTGVSAARFQGRLEVSDDGRKFRKLRDFVNYRPVLALPFEPVSARYYRWVFTEAAPGLERLEFSELELAPVFRLEMAGAKAGLGPLPANARAAALPEPPPYGLIALTNLVDLTARTTPDGRLDWEVPPGDWTVLRFACVPNGRPNHPAPPGGLGLECDKLSREAIRAHFDSFLRKLVAEVGDDAGRAFTATHIDSWEVGYQNWTPLFREEFTQRRGYDPLPYLPATAGRVVASREQSERFLWDMRRTIADLLADNYAGELARLGRRHGLQLSIEPYGSLGSGPFDDLLYAARADVPMTEFWLEDAPFDRLHLKAMPSVAHTRGKAVVAAEAFTSYPAYGKWLNHPFSLKPLGDAAFCEGVNRFVFHRYVHQPWVDRAPGVTLGPFGIHYERTQTWWEQSTAWHQYVARCQFLLQRGLFVADVCYLTDEGAYTSPPPGWQLEPRPVPGYDYDLATAEVVLERLSVKDGRLVLPDGMSYALLVLPPNDRMTPKLLRKIRDLVVDGATILGPRPTRSPSLTGYPQCDDEVEAIALELWGPAGGNTTTDRAVGKGKVLSGRTLEEVFAAAALPPDFKQLTPGPGYALHYIHRRMDGAEVYFVANVNAPPPGATGGEFIAECQFRVAGKQPEIWHPDTGQIERPARWREQAGNTILPLRFDPAGSMVVVFRNPSRGLDPVVSATVNGRSAAWVDAVLDPNGRVELTGAQPGGYEFKTASGKTLTAVIPALPEPALMAGLWEVRFPPRTGAPEAITLDRLVSWAEHPHPGVKYFSGTATYRKTFTVPPEFVAPNRKVRLDLGRVAVLAAVKVNGRDRGILWKPPFVADLTGVVKAGENQLEIQVVNLWPNRLIGDEQLPDDCQWRPGGPEFGQLIAAWPQWLLEGKPSPTGRITFSSWKHWPRHAPLLESGLLGPVRLQVIQVEPLKTAGER